MRDFLETLAWLLVCALLLVGAAALTFLLPRAARRADVTHHAAE